MNIYRKCVYILAVNETRMHRHAKTEKLLQNNECASVKSVGGFGCGKNKIIEKYSI